MNTASPLRDITNRLSDLVRSKLQEKVLLSPCFFYDARLTLKDWHVIPDDEVITAHVVDAINAFTINGYLDGNEWLREQKLHVIPAIRIINGDRTDEGRFLCEVEAVLRREDVGVVVRSSLELPVNDDYRAKILIAETQVDLARDKERRKKK